MYYYYYCEFQDGEETPVAGKGGDLYPVGKTYVLKAGPEAPRVFNAGKPTAKGPPRCVSTPEAKSPKKAAAPQQAPAEPKPKPVSEAKASKPVKGQESPETKVSHPMETRQHASRAGGLRSGGGSGQTDTCVAQGNPSKT
jgi:hypothetical protein